MTHGYSRQDWIDYTTGGSDAARKSDFEAHLAGCEVCRQTAAQLAAIDERLSIMAQKLRESRVVADSEIKEAFRTWQLQAAQSNPAEPRQLIRLELSN